MCTAAQGLPWQLYLRDDTEVNIRCRKEASNLAVFITSKISPKDVAGGREHAYESILMSMKRLGIEQIDLYLIHWPGRSRCWCFFTRISCNTPSLFDCLRTMSYPCPSIVWLKNELPVYFLIGSLFSGYLSFFCLHIFFDQVAAPVCVRCKIRFLSFLFPPVYPRYIRTWMGRGHTHVDGPWASQQEGCPNRRRSAFFPSMPFSCMPARRCAGSQGFESTESPIAS